MKKNKFKQLFNQIYMGTKSKIRELANSELNNTERKQTLDKYIISLIRKVMDYLGFNFVERWVVEHYLIPYVDDVTQYIYDLMKKQLNKKIANNSVKLRLNPINEI